MQTKPIEKYFAGKSVIITGGATGIGREMSRALTLARANLLLIGRRENLLEELQTELLKAKPSSHQTIAILACDVSDRALLEEKLPARLKDFDVDVLFNNAGIACSKRFMEISPDEYNHVIDVNFLGAVNVTRLVLPKFIEKKHGHIGFVCSLAGKVGVVGYSAYTPSKFAMAGFAEVLRNEFKSQEISISVLYPPDVATPLLDGENLTKPPELLALDYGKVLRADSVAREYLEGVARGRFEIIPGRVAKIVAFLIRHFPRLVAWANDRSVGKAQSKIHRSSWP